MKLLKYTATLFLLMPLFAAAQTVPAFPMAFWGNATINGSAAPMGTVIRAYYGSTLAGSATVQESGVYGYTEPTKQKLVVREGAGSISFTVQSASFNGGAETPGTVTITQSGFTSALTVQKDLAFTISVPSSGGSSGGGGGGGAVIPAATTVKKGDASGDGKVDVLDFNALLIQWGKSGASLTADFNADGIVDILDFNQLLINWAK